MENSLLDPFTKFLTYFSSFQNPLFKSIFFFFFPFRRSYYLLVALTSEGQLIFEEDREGSAFGVRLNDINFLNGARHSIYYVRDNSTVTFLVRLINDKRFRNSRHSRMTYNDHSSNYIDRSRTSDTVTDPSVDSRRGRESRGDRDPTWRSEHDRLAIQRVQGIHRLSEQ